MSDELITLGEAAKILKIHRATMARLVDDGKIAAVTLPARHRAPGRWRYVKRSDVEAFARTYDPRPGRRKKTRGAAPKSPRPSTSPDAL